MKAIFPTSKYGQLLKLIEENPDMIGVELTLAEIVSIYDELLAAQNVNAIFINDKNRYFIINGKQYMVIPK